MIVVDASVLFAAAIKDGTTRKALLDCTTPLAAPPYLWEQVHARRERILAYAQVGQASVDALLGTIASKITTIESSVFDHHRAEAQRRCEHAQAWGDDEYVALALALQAPIWTLDRDFERVAGIDVVAGPDVKE